MTDLTNQWYQAIRISPTVSDDDKTASNGQPQTSSRQSSWQLQQPPVVKQSNGGETQSLIHRQNFKI